MPESQLVRNEVAWTREELEKTNQLLQKILDALTGNVQNDDTM